LVDGIPPMLPHGQRFALGPLSLCSWGRNFSMYFLFSPRPTPHLYRHFDFAVYQFMLSRSLFRPCLIPHPRRSKPAFAGFFTYALWRVLCVPPEKRPFQLLACLITVSFQHCPTGPHRWCFFFRYPALRSFLSLAVWRTFTPSGPIILSRAPSVRDLVSLFSAAVFGRCFSPLLSRGL